MGPAYMTRELEGAPGDSLECSSLNNEGGAIHETFADINGLISMLDDPEYNLAYDTAGVRLSQQPSRHRNGTPPLLYSPLACDDADDIHDVGRPLQQAMWEILWNQDCASGCAPSSPTTALTRDSQERVRRWDQGVGLRCCSTRLSSGVQSPARMNAAQ
jgi:hypothetical protein